MTKEEAINVLKTRSCYECSWGCYSPVSCSCGSCDLTEAAEIAIESLETPKWIPVTERFPKEGDSYIIYHESFGTGKIVEVTNTLVSVAFKHPHGIKKLMKNHKKLSKI